ncbi:MAG: RDD family protein [Candidatus Hydrogenedentes bacterium]|nr:RDD family protein [Candidatus Hydrogenedentota bacterium]
MGQTRTNTLDIRTPEGITFSLLLAGPPTRFLAWAIDRACIAVVFWALRAVLALVVLPAVGFMGAAGTDLSMAVSVVAFFLINLGYNIVLEWLWRGQTIGKRALRLRVMDEQGLQLQFSQVVVRNLMRFVDAIPVFYLVGGLACLLSKRAQRLGDFAANTIVVRLAEVEEPNLDQVLPGKYNSFRAYPHLEARLRQRVSPEDARIAVQALLRRDALHAQARVELFQQIADHLRSLVPFPEEATLGLTDEQYVRNVVDALFRGRERGNGDAPGPLAAAPPEQAEAGPRPMV